MNTDKTLHQHMTFYTFLSFSICLLTIAVLAYFWVREWIIVWLFLAFIFMVYTIIHFKMQKFNRRAIHQTEILLYKLKKGDFQGLFTYEPEKSLNRLDRIVYDIAHKHYRAFNFAQTQQDQLEALLDNIGSSFVYVDEMGRVQLANHHFIKTFKLKRKHWFQKDFRMVFKEESLQDHIAQSMQKSQVVYDELVLSIGIERKYFNLICTPMRQHDREKASAVIVLHDITALKKLEKVRKEFVANVSHELKTPVTSVKGFAETLIEEDMHEDVQREFLQIILNESQRLETVIQDLLELSKIENENFELKKASIDLAQVIHETISLLQNKIKEKSLQIDVNVHGETHLHADFLRMKQICINILSNAVEYSQRSGIVKIGIEEKKDNLQLTIVDQGIGISEKEIPRIFERFYRVDRARSRHSGGTGLGLAIVKHLTEAHGGAISVRSVLSEGSEFMFEFPKK